MRRTQLTTHRFAAHPVFRSGLLALAILTHATLSIASPLPAGTTLFPAPTGPLNGGTLAAPVLVQNFVSPTYTGTLTSEVFTGDGTNPLGGLTFVYIIQNTSPFPGEIDRLTVNSYSGYKVNAVYVPSPNVPPLFIDRSVGTGDTIGFSFVKPPLGTGSIQPGQSSDVLIAYTDANMYAGTLASVIDGSVAQVPSYAPMALIPEPSTLVLTCFAAISWVAVSMWRHDAAKTLPVFARSVASVARTAETIVRAEAGPHLRSEQEPSATDNPDAYG